MSTVFLESKAQWCYYQCPSNRVYLPSALPPDTDTHIFHAKNVVRLVTCSHPQDLDQDYLGPYNDGDHWTHINRNTRTHHITNCHNFHCTLVLHHTQGNCKQELTIQKKQWWIWYLCFTFQSHYHIWFGNSWVKSSGVNSSTFEE